MQTFLPYPDFEESARCLDMRRLGKQRVETWQIYLALTKEGYGWKNHPAVKMWKDYEEALLVYGKAICKEWIRRGYKDTMHNRFVEEHNKRVSLTIYPCWLGYYSFHKSHRSNLLRKDPDHYRKFFPDIPDDLEYIWPIK